MKKFFALAAIAAAFSFTMTSCGDDSKDVTPTKVLPNTYTAKLLGAQSATPGSFFSTSTGIVYGAGDSANFTSNKVDISFAETGSPTAVAKFISLSARRNEGLSKVTTVNRASSFTFTGYTKAQFDTVSNAFVSALPAGGLATVPVTQGRVYIMVNTEGKKALIYVSALSSGSAVGLSQVTIDVKAAK